MLQAKIGMLAELPVDAIYAVLKNVSFFSVLIPIGFCLAKIKTLNKTLRVLFVYFILSGLTDLLSYIFSSSCITCCYATENIFTLVQFCAFSYVYYLEFAEAWAKTAIKYIAISYLAFSAIILLFMDGLFKESNIITVLEGILLLILTFFFLYGVLKDMNNPRLTDDSFIWFSFAVMIYFSVALVLFFSDDYLRNCPKDTFKMLWSLHLLANIAFNVLASVSIWKRKVFKPE
jgi:hypothetical protein